MDFVIQTCTPRDPEPLFRRLVDQSVSGAGDNDVVAIHEDRDQVGQCQTMLEILSSAAASERAVTLLEDDIEVCDGFVPYVGRNWRVPGVEVVHWFAHGDVPREGPRWRKLSGARYMFNQAVTFSATACRRITRSHLALEWTRDQRHNGDMLIGKVMAALNWKFAIHTPSLVQHAGHLSVVAPLCRLAGYRVSSQFVGEDFDASSLELPGGG